MNNMRDLEWWHNSTVIRFLLEDFASTDNLETSDWVEGETIDACIACGCKFHNESHLDRHLSMKVVYINFKCEHCGHLSLFNKCELIYHIYAHGEPIKAFNLSDIKISFLPSSVKDIMGTIRFNKFPSRFIYTMDKSNKTNITFISRYKYASYSMLEELGFAIVGSAIISDKIWTVNQGDVLGYLYSVPETVEIRFKDQLMEDNSEVSERENASSEIQSTVCPECNKVIKTNFDLHFNPGNKFWDSRIRCKYCQTVLATNCQLSAHERLHMKKAPFICPECGDRFTNYDELFDHFLTRCLHLVKSAYFNCPDSLCRRAYTVVENLMGHLLNYHVERYAYCVSCSLMCITRDLLNQHKVNCDIVTVYKCSFCKDDGKMLYDIRNHLANEHKMLLFARYGYYCTKCKRRNMELPTYTNHLKECNSDLLKISRFRNQIHIHKTNVHNFIPDTFESNVDVEHECRSNVNNDRLSESEKIIDRSTSDIMLFNENTLNTEVFGESLLTVLQSNKENLRMKSFGEGNSTVTSAPTEEYLSKRINDEDIEIDGTEVINELVQDKDNVVPNEDLQNINSDKSNELFDARSNEEKTEKNENDDTVETREGNIVSVSNDKLISEPITELQEELKIRAVGKIKEIYKCGVCIYSSNIQKDFETHLFKHKMNNTEYQCLECGVCFAVKPTFAKHLIASHKIMDVERYISTHNCIDFEAIEDLRLRSVNPNCKKDQFDENECCVCEEKFHSKKELDLHLRVHGMVYLTKNKFGKTNKV